MTISEIIERVLDVYEDEGREAILDECEITAERLIYILVKGGYLNEETMPWAFEKEPSCGEYEQDEQTFDYSVEEE